MYWSMYTFESHEEFIMFFFLVYTTIIQSVRTSTAAGFAPMSLKKMLSTLRGMLISL